MNICDNIKDKDTEIENKDKLFYFKNYSFSLQIEEEIPFLEQQLNSLLKLRKSYSIYPETIIFRNEMMSYEIYKNIFKTFIYRQTQYIKSLGLRERYIMNAWL